MHRLFSGRWQDRAGAIFMLCICLGCVAMGIYFPFARHYAPGEAWTPYVGMAIFFAMGGGMGAILIWGLMESFTQYTADETGITRSSVFRTEKMSWRDIVSFKTTGSGSRAVYCMTDNFGQKMTVYLHMVPHAEELAQVLEVRLEPLRQAQIKEFDASAFDRKPGMAQVCLGIFILLFGAGIVGACIYLFVAAPGQVTTPTYAIGIIGGLGCAMGGLFIGMALYVMTRRMVITRDHIAVSSIYGKKVVPFNRVASLLSRDRTYNHGITNVTTIKGVNGAKIELTDVIPNYAALLQFIRDRVGEQAIQQGQTELPQLQRKERRISLIVMSIVLPIGLLYLGWRTWGGFQELNREMLLDRKHADIKGKITNSREISEDKARVFQMAYRFDVGGKEYRSVTNVNADQYQHVQNGDEATIQYLPGNPNVSRYIPSNAKRHAIASLAVVGFYVLLLGGGLLYELAKAIVKKRRAAQTQS